jgi:hypothetical protein
MRPPKPEAAREPIGGLTVRCFRNDRPPDGWCPAVTPRLVSVAMPVSAAMSDQIGRMSGRLPDAGHQRQRKAVLAGSHPGHGSLCTAQADADQERVYRRPHSPSSKRSMIGVRLPWPLQLPVQHRSGPTAETAGHFRGGRPGCRPGSGHRRTLCRVRCPPGGAVARGTGRRVGGR